MTILRISIHGKAITLLFLLSPSSITPLAILFKTLRPNIHIVLLSCYSLLSDVAHCIVFYFYGTAFLFLPSLSFCFFLSLSRSPSLRLHVYHVPLLSPVNRRGIDFTKVPVIVHFGYDV
uniref:Uncharacterized protein n=1 Tax=Cacopsylla melanoneura TaxID=428564 RepID=A0A8D8YZ79_9HEMI